MIVHITALLACFLSLAHSSAWRARCQRWVINTELTVSQSAIKQRGTPLISCALKAGRLGQAVPSKESLKRVNTPGDGEITLQPHRMEGCTNGE